MVHDTRRNIKWVVSREKSTSIEYFIYIIYDNFLYQYICRYQFVMYKLQLWREITNIQRDHDTSYKFFNWIIFRSLWYLTNIIIGIHKAIELHDIFCIFCRYHRDKDHWGEFFDLMVWWLVWDLVEYFWF